MKMLDESADHPGLVKTQDEVFPSQFLYGERRGERKRTNNK